MKKIAIAITLVAMLATCASSASAALIITGVVDGPRTGGLPKAIELYASTAIADLSDYALGSANNGGGTDGAEFILTGSAAAGSYIWVASESPGFTAYFGFAPTLVNSAAANVNGDDAVELFYDPTAAALGDFGASDVVDVFGDINAAPAVGASWNYQDSYAYRVDGTGPDGATFVIANWTFGGSDVLDSQGASGTNGGVVPFGTYEAAVIPEPTTAGLAFLAAMGLVTLRRRSA
jgi:hypothetical protein